MYSVKIYHVVEADCFIPIITYMRYLFVLLLLIPIIEIMLFIEAGQWIGTGPTLLMIFVTAVIGVALIRQQGLQSLFRAQEKMNRGEVPAYEMLEGIFFAVAGICLLTPGFFTDGIGFLLLIPVFRRLIIAKMSNMTSVHTAYSHQNTEQRTIEGEFQHKDNDR